MAYEYRPLNSPTEEIRLLKIHPGQDDDPLSCTLTTNHPLSQTDCPPYAALSYTWGAIQPRHTITLNECSFLIRANLWSFLHQLRRLVTHAYLWTDAICIDQANVLEKNAQVPLMGQVYARAARVLVYLGPAADQSQLIMDLVTQQPPNRSAAECTVDWDAMDLSRYAPALFKLCNRPYWDRTWIIQEILLARGEVLVLCGPTMTTLQSLQAVHGSYCEFALFEGGDAMAFTGAEEYDFTQRDGLHRLSYNFRKRTLELLIEVYQETLCADPRDKVYAVQSMVVDSPMVVDYAVDLPEFYWRVIAHCNTATPPFGKMLRHCLGIPLRKLWDFATRKHGLSMLPVMQTGLNELEAVASLPLEEIGFVSGVEDIGNHAHPQQGQSDGVARVRFIPFSLPIKGVHCVTGFASDGARRGDLICVVAALSGCGLLIRKQTENPSLEDTTHILHPSFCLLMEPDAHQSIELATIVNSQHRLNTLGASIRTRGFPIHRVDVDQSPPPSTPGMNLILNYAALLAIMEVAELVQHGIDWAGMTMYNGPGKDLQPR